MNNSHVKLVCAVTGAKGNLGSRVVAFLRSSGLQVVEMGRSGCEIDFQLGNKLDCQEFLKRTIKVVIHCAHDFTQTTWLQQERINIEGSKLLLQSARSGGVERFIFVSSMASFEKAKSKYGQAKFRVEKEVARTGGVSIRPGLIYGSKIDGIVGALENAIRKLPLIPVIGSGSQILYLTHEEDICASLLRLVSEPQWPAGQVFTLASEQGLSFKEILRELAARQNKRVTLITLPWHFVWLGLKVLECLGLKMRTGSDSVLSLVNQNPAPEFESGKTLGSEVSIVFAKGLNTADPAPLTWLNHIYYTILSAGSPT